MLEFNKEVVQFKLNEEIHEVKKPNNLEIKNYTDGLSKCKDGDEREELLKSFLESLGLRKDIYDLLLPAQLNLVLKEIYSSEKN